MEKIKAVRRVIHTAISRETPEGSELHAEIYGVGLVYNRPFQFLKIARGLKKLKLL